MNRSRFVGINYRLLLLLVFLLTVSSLVASGDETPTTTPTPTVEVTPVTTLSTEAPTPTQPAVVTQATAEPAADATETVTETATETVTATAEVTSEPTAETTPEPTVETPTAVVTQTQPPATEEPTAVVTDEPTPTSTVVAPDNIVTAIFSYTGADTFDPGLNGWNVCFTDASTGVITSRAWDFGDGTTSTETSPCHLYTTAGLWNISLTVAGDKATSSATQVISLVQNNSAPVAAYSANRTSIYVGQDVSFTDLSTGTISGWAWTFGDGATSTDRNPTHVYSAVGEYPVTLTVTGSGGNASVQTVTVRVTERPVATLTCDFSAPGNIFEDTGVRLDGRVNNPPSGVSLTYTWTINDAVLYTTEDATHTFADPGSYVVTFTVTPQDDSAPCSRTRTLTVKASTGAYARFDRSPSAGATGTEVIFTDRSTGAVVAWAWNFGDGATSTDQNPRHTYNDAGRYTARLTVTAQDGSTTSATQDITIHAPQTISIEATPATGVAPVQIQLHAVTSNINVNTLEWTFPDGSKAYGVNALYTFRAGGEFVVSVQGSGALGVTTAEQTLRIGTLSSIRASFAPSRWEGTAPVEICYTDQSAGEALDTWAWQSGDGQTSAEQNPCFTYNEGGEYTVHLTVSNAYGLSANASNVVRVGNRPVEPTVMPPTETPTDTNPPIIDVFDPSLSKLGYLPQGSTGLPGEELVWEVTVTNNGGTPTSDTVVTDTLRSELRVISVNTPVGTSNISGQVVTVNIPPSALQNSGDSVTFTILTEVLTTPDDRRIDNTARITDENIQASAAVTLADPALGGGVVARMAPPTPSGPIPHIINTTERSGFAGISQCDQVAFVNQGTNPGFGPYVTLITEQGAAGLTVNSIDYLGTNLLNAPFLVASGNIPANATWVAPLDPFDGRPIPAPVGFDPTHNYRYVTVRLPVGSVVTGGPLLDVDVCYSVGALADIELPYTLDFYAGYEFGDSATGIGGPDTFDGSISNLDDPLTPNPNSSGSDNHGTFTPVLVTLEKNNTLPESEVPPSCYPITGAIADPGNGALPCGASPQRPAWPYEYTISIELAPGQTITSLGFVDTLDAKFQLYPYSAPALPTVASDIVRTGAPAPASTCTFAAPTLTLNGASPFPFTPISPTIPTIPGTRGGTLGINFASVTNPSATATCVVNMTYRGFATDILGESGPPNVDSIVNTVGFNYSYQGTPRPAKTATNTVDVRNQLFQKTASPLVVSPGDVVSYTIEFQITEYDNINTLTIVDTIPDGIDFNVGSANVTVPTVGGPVPLTGANATITYGSETGTLTFNVTGALPGPYPGGGTGTITYTGTVLQEYRLGGALTGFVSANDVMPNSIVGAFTTTQGNSFNDESAASVSVGPNTLTKNLISVPTDASTGFVPGEPVTFRLVFEIPSGDTRNVLIEDFFPLPVFDIDDGDFGLRPTASQYTTMTVPNSGADTYELITGTTPLGYCSTYANVTFPAYTNSCGVRIVYGNNRTNLPAGSTVSVLVDGATNSVKVRIDNAVETGVTVGRRIVLDFTAAVVDQPFNDSLYLSNLARANYTDSRSNPVNVDAIDYLGVAAPDVQICKGIIDTSNPNSTTAAGAACGVPGAPNDNLISADAGDLVTYQITVRNIGGANAYDVRISDDVLTIAQLNSCTLVEVRDGTGSTVGNGSPVTYTGTFPNLTLNGPILPDRSTAVSTAQATVNVRYTCNITQAIVPGGAALVNTATTRFAPFSELLLPNTHVNPTTTDFPPRTDVASVTPRIPTIVKTRTPATATIGDLITYTLTLDIPGGTLTNATLVDTLDTGLAFADCSSIAISIPTAPNVPLTSSNGTLDTATFCNDGTTGSNNPVISSSGRVATWNFGTLTNTGTNADDRDTITITYTAVVLNTVANVRGQNRNNSAVFNWGTFNISAQSPDTTIVEPTLQVAKTQQRITPSVSPGSLTTANINADAGDVVRYRLVVDHTATSNATAYDITLSDVIPTNMTYLAGSLNTTGSTATGCNAVLAGSTVNVTATSIAIGQQCTITFDVTLDNTVQPRQTLTNQTVTNSLKWTTQPGTPPTVSPYDPTSVERDGSTCTAPNNYCATSNAVNVIVPDPIVAKAVFSTSEPTTGTSQYGAPNDLTIGETVTYRITYTFSDGLTRNVILRDVLPTGTVAFTYISSQVISIGGQLTTANGLAVGQAGTVVGNIISWDAGNVTNTPNSPNAAVGADDRIVLEVVARVADNALNVGINPGADVNVSNTGRIVYSDAGSITRTLDVTAPVDIVEPQLQNTKTTVTAMPVDASLGNNVTFRLVISHTAASTADAFNVLVTDTLPPNMTFGAVTTASANCGTVTAGGTSTVPTFTFPTLVRPNSCTIDFTARLADTAQGSSSYENGVVTRYDSQPVYVPTETRRTTTPPATSLVTTLAPTLTKVRTSTDITETANADVNPAEEVTYLLTATLPEGTTPAFVVRDVLPANMSLVSATVTTIGSNISGSSLAVGAACAFASPNVTCTFGNLVNAADDSANASDQITITVVTRVSTTVSVGDTLTNTANTSFTRETCTVAGGCTSSPGTTPNQTVTVTVVEPNIVITKTANPTSGDAGDIITYTILLNNTGNGPAFNVTVADAVPVAFLNDSGTSASLTCGGANNTTCTYVSPNLSVIYSTILPGTTRTITYTAVLRTTVPASGQIVNTATQTTNSRPDGTGKTYTTDDDATVEVEAPQLDKRVVSTSFAPTTPDNSGVGLPNNSSVVVTQGETVTYEFIVTVPEGAANNLVLTDTLPVGMAYISSRVMSIGGSTTNSATSGGNIILTGSSVSVGASCAFATPVVTCSFGNANNAPDGATDARDEIRVQVTTRALNTNAAGALLTNTGRINYTGAPATPITDTEEVRVVAPNLNIVKSFNPTITVSGGTSTLRLVVTNPVGANISTAYNVNVLDQATGFMDSRYELLTGTILADLSLAPGSAQTANTSTGGFGTSRVNLMFDQLVPGETITITATVHVDPALSPSNVSIPNDTRVNGGSLPPTSTDYAERGTSTDDDDEPLVVQLRLGGKVWRDDNADGSTTQIGPNPNDEKPFSSVTVRLCSDAACTTVVATTTTDGNGDYLFEPVPAGTYFIVVTRPPGYGPTFDVDGTGTPDVTQVVVTNANIFDLNFGYRGTSSLGDKVWLDADSSGTLNGSEVGIPGRIIQITGTDSLGNAVSRQETTDTNGDYLFSNLPPSGGVGYTVTVTNPPAGATQTYDLDGTATASTAVATLGAGQNRTDVDFGYHYDGSIGDFVWFDADSNGLFDGTDVPLPNVQLILEGTDIFGNDVNLTQTTNAAGYYLFDNLAPSSTGYKVSVVPATLGGITTPTFNRDAVVDNETVVTLTANQNVTDADFGYTAITSLGDRVWLDLNADGAQDVGEPGIPGLTVTLTGNDTFGNVVNRTTTTVANGLYLFDNLAPSDGTGYTVTVTPPAGLLPTYNWDSEIGNTATPDNQNMATVLAAGDAERRSDFGYVGNASLGDRVWLDLNADGLQDVGEPGLVGLTVVLTGTDALGNTVTRSTVTVANGIYTFDDLVPSDVAGYTVTVTPPAGATPTYDLDGNTTGISANVATGAVVTAAGANQNRIDVDFGYTGNSSIGNYVWLDDDSDGVQDASENGLGGVTVTLTGNDIFGNLITRTTTTDTSGAYLFDNLFPSDTNGYTVTVTPPAGVVNTYDLDNGIITPNNAAIVMLGANEDRTDVDFGYVGNASLGDKVWLDIDSDGTLDVGEAGISNRTITLTGTDSFNNPVSRTTTTDANGDYLFSNLPPSDGTGYTVTVTNPPTGATQTYDLDGIATASTAVATLGAGQNRTDVDFGYHYDGSIGDFTWFDANNNGLFDGTDVALPNVQLTLVGTDIFGNPVSLTQTTDAAGYYLFDNLAPSTTGYTVSVVPASLGAFTTQTFDRDAVLNNQTLVTLTANQNVLDADFGYTAITSLGDLVWLDLNADGVQDSGEPGIPGLTVTLTGNDTFGNVVNRTTTTGANGLYLFDNLAPSDGTGYTVTVTPPAGLLPTYNWDSEIGNTATPDNQNTATVLAAGDAERRSDFGYRGTGSIGDLVYQDVNASNTFDAGDVPLANVTLQLTGTDVFGNTISLTTTTDASGIYLFDNLPAGTYSVSVVGPVLDPVTGVVMTNTVVPPGATVTLGVTGGVVDSVMDRDFGFRYVPPPPVSPSNNGGNDDPSVTPTPTPAPTVAPIQRIPGTTSPALPAIIPACSTECVDFEFYHTNRTGNWEIYRLGDYRGRADANPNISQGEGDGMDDIAPSRSPNAEWVAFASNRDGNWEIYVAPTSGETAEIRRVTHNTIAVDTNPVWGPNNQIVYETTRNGNWDLYLVDMVTGQESALVTDAASDLNADWSADGTRLLFQSDRSGQWQIYELDLRTGTQTLVSDGTANDVDPQYSSDGTRISFLSDRTGSDVIFVADAGGSNPRAVSETETDAANATWSPSGNLIAYQSDRDGDLDVYVVNVATGQTRQLTDNAIADFAPAWLCGSDDLLFTSEISGNTDIYRAAALPLSAPAIDVMEDAVRETDDDAQDVYPMGAPVNEYASREGLTLGSVAMAAANTEFLQPETATTLRDTTTLDNTDWVPLIGCTSRVCQPWNVYLSNPNGIWNVFRLDAAGATANISRGTENDYSPSASPDKRFIAFTSVRDGDPEIFVIASDGSGTPIQITSNDTVDDNPTWSQDGQYLVYESDAAGNFDLYRRDLTTGVTTRLTTAAGDDRFPFMSFGGGEVLFQSNRDGRSQIYELTLATNKTRRLGDGTASDTMPIYSFDGGRILFISDRDGDRGLFMMNRDGSAVVRISPEGQDARFGSWSVNSDYVAFEASSDAGSNIYVYEVASGTIRQVTDNDAVNTTPAWRCDSDDLLFTSDVMGNPDIFQVSALPISAEPIRVQQDAERLTTSSNDDSFPLGSADETASRSELDGQ